MLELSLTDGLHASLVLEAHKSVVTGVSFNHDAGRLATCSLDASLKVRVGRVVEWSLTVRAGACGTACAPEGLCGRV